MRIIDNLGSLGVPVQRAGVSVPVAAMPGFERLADRVAFKRQNEAAVMRMRGQMPHVFDVKPSSPKRPALLQYPSIDDLWLSETSGSPTATSPSFSLRSEGNGWPFPPSAPLPTPPPKDWPRQLVLLEKRRHRQAEQSLERAYNPGASNAPGRAS